MILFFLPAALMAPSSDPIPKTVTTVAGNLPTRAKLVKIIHQVYYED